MVNEKPNSILIGYFKAFYAPLIPLFVRSDYSDLLIAEYSLLNLVIYLTTESKEFNSLVVIRLF